MDKNRPRIRPRINEWMATYSFIREKFVDGLWARLASLRELQSLRGRSCARSLGGRCCRPLRGMLRDTSESDAVIYPGELMKLFQSSLILGMLSYIIGGVFRRSGSSLGEMSLGIQGSAIFLLVILPAGIGAVLGVMSLNRKEVKAWWAIGVVVFSIVMILTGIFLLFAG